MTRKRQIRALLVSCFSLLATALMAQSGAKVTVSGVVTSAEDNEPLIGVAVVTEAMTGVTTSIDGSYSIQAEAGTKLIFQYIGFQQAEWVVPAGQAAVTYDLQMQR